MRRFSQHAAVRALRVLLSNPALLSLARLRMIRRLFWIVVVFQLSLTAAQSPARHVDREQLMRDLTTLASPAFEGRRTGTPGALKARQWIVEQFRGAGLSPAGASEYLQPFTFSTTDRRALLPGGQPFRTEYSAANVIGRLVGREPRART